MSKLLYRKFIQDSVYQMLSELTRFCGRYDKNILVCFFSSRCSTGICCMAEHRNESFNITYM